MPISWKVPYSNMQGDCTGSMVPSRMFVSMIILKKSASTGADVGKTPAGICGNGL